jgi:hypothetical protein
MSEALARGFEQWNRMLIDQQQWDARREVTNAQAETQHMLAREQAKDMAVNREKMQLSIQGQRIQNQLAQEELNNIEAYKTPVQQSVYPIIGRDFVNNPEQLDAVKKTFGHLHPDIKINPADGSVYGGGQPLLISGQQMSQMLPMLDLIRTGWQDTPVEARLSLAEKTEQLSTLQAEYKKLGNTERGNIEKVPIFAKMAKLRDEIKVLTPLASDDGALKSYSDSTNRYRTAASYAYANYGKQAGDFLSKRGDEFFAKEQTLRKARYNKKTKSPAMKWLQRYNADPKSDRYGQTVGVPFPHDPSGPAPDPGALISYSAPPAIKAGQNNDGLGPPMTEDQMVKNFRNYYKSAHPSGFIGDVTLKEMEGKIGTAQAIGKNYGETKKKDGTYRGYGDGLDFGKMAVSSMEKKYWEPLERIEELGKLKTKDGQRADLAEGYRLLSEDKAFARFVADSGEKLNEDNIQEALKAWAISIWMTTAVKPISEGGYGLDERQIYTPNATTRRIQKSFDETGKK